jgi:hypothetical protein
LEIGDMIAQAVAAAVDRMISKDEGDLGREGRHALAESIRVFAEDIQERCHTEATELFKVARAIREGRIV